MNTRELPTRNYSPEPLLGHPLKLASTILSDIWIGRGLAWSLFQRDLSAQYRQTILGYIWAFLPPLAASATFIFLSSQKIVNIDTGSIPYPAFAMIGTLLWQVFVDSLLSPIAGLTKGKPMLVKINFPREAILTSGIYMVIFNFFIRLILVVVVMLTWKVPVGPSLAFFPLAMASLMLLGFSLGLILTPISGLYGDIAKAIPVIASFWMLLTPVVYPPRDSGLAGILATWNPVSPIVTTAREALTAQPFTLLYPFAIVTVLAFALTCLGFISFRLAMPHLITRMGG